MSDFTLPDGSLVHLIGDPHLGKKFEVGVPLARRGEREASQLAHFKAELEWDADIIVMVGDLFDHPYVGYWTAQEASRAVEHAVVRHPEKTFIMMAGNHDMPRNVTNVGAFDDFRDRLAFRFENLHILNEPQVINGIAYFPWQWNATAKQQALDLTHCSPVHAAVGHWDLASFNGKEDHLAPVDLLLDAFGDIEIYGGHYHVPGDYPVGRGVVHCTGSLEPYTHGEDPDGLLYVTLSREDALSGQGRLKNMNVRIRLKPGEDMPDLDCLALTFIREKEGVDEGATPDYQKPTRDWSNLLATKLAPLDERVRVFIMDRINVDNSEEQC